jgi:putative endopeptidase
MTRAGLVALLVVGACSGGGAPRPVARGPEPLAPVGPAEPLAPVGPAEPSAPAAPVAAPAPVSAAAGVKVTLGDVGLEAALLDRTTDPCIDFYQFACGGWLAANPPPPERARVSRLTELDDKVRAALAAVLEDAARGTGDKKLGNYYAACLDEAAVEQAGLAALRPALAKIQAVKDARSWLAALIELHKLGVFAVFEHQVLPDLKDAKTHVAYLDASGLTLPDRSYYLDPARKDAVDALQQHAARVLALAGAPGDPADVVALETELAKLTRTAAEQRDLAALYNPTDARGLARQARSIDWPAYLRGVGASGKKLIVATPALFAGLDRLRAQYKPARWSAYFTVQLLDHFAFALPAAFDAEAFALARQLTGVERPRDRASRCVDATARALPDLLAQPYLARTLVGSVRDDATRIVDAVVAAVAAQLAAADWLSDATRQLAAAKLARITRMVGFPERWRTYDFEVRRGDFTGNAVRAAAAATRRAVARAGKPVDRGEWHMAAFDVGAYYNPSVNHLVVPASLLQRPLFGPDRAVAANLGGLGELIGHELIHAFDDHGAQYDADGTWKPWWPPADAARLRDRAQCVVDQYATFEALPRQRISGTLTLGENVADLGGVKAAFAAYRALRKGAAKTYVADGYSEDQQFFLAVGQASCQRDRPGEAQRRLQVDPHAPAKFRVYGALRNLPEFAEAFHCAAGTPMRPAKPCAVW